MKFPAFVLSLLLATPALAQQPPTTVTFPSGTVLEIRRYLGRQPYDDVAQMIGQMEICVRAQALGASAQAMAACPVTAKNVAQPVGAGGVKLRQ